MHRILLMIVAFLCASDVSAAGPFRGAKESNLWTPRRII